MHEFKSLSSIVKNREAFADDINQDQTAQNMQTGLGSLSSLRLVKPNIIKFWVSVKYYFQALKEIDIKYVVPKELNSHHHHSHAYLAYLWLHLFITKTLVDAFPFLPVPNYVKLSACH